MKHLDTNDLAEQVREAPTSVHAERILRAGVEDAIAATLRQVRDELEEWHVPTRFVVQIDNHVERAWVAAQDAREELEYMPGGSQWPAMVRAVRGIE